MKLFSAISSINEANEKIFKRRSGNVNSLSHAFAVKEVSKDTNSKELQEKPGDKKINKDGKSKIQRPNIIIKNKNHDKKVNIHKLQKFK